jgi:hypothetical protein
VGFRKKSRKGYGKGGKKRYPPRYSKRRESRVIRKVLIPGIIFFGLGILLVSQGTNQISIFNFLDDKSAMIGGMVSLLTGAILIPFSAKKRKKMTAKNAIRLAGVIVLVAGFMVGGLSGSNPDQETMLTFFVLIAIGFVMISQEKIKNLFPSRPECNCCACTNCDLDHDHWQHRRRRDYDYDF